MTANVKQFRPSSTGPVTHVDVPTLLKPECPCAWVVIRSGPGFEAISRLKTASRMCPHPQHQKVLGGGW